MGALVPEHIKVQIQAYIRSDKLDTNATIALGGRCSLDTFKDLNFTEFTKVAVQTINASLDTDDARPMTLDEVKAYDEQQREEAEENGDIAESMRLDDDDDDE